MLKKHSKLIVLLVVLSFLFSIVGTAAAAVPTDVTGSKYQSAVEKMNALKSAGTPLLTGYPDGTFKPENPITRAEFCAVVVRELGMEAAAKATASATKFADVPASHWAAGYVNVAVSQGIIKGYPDNTFKPSANVTYAEAMAMLVRALGYEPSVQGPWPQGYVAKASEIGIAKGVNPNPSAPATRGDVAIMAANSLEIDTFVQTGWGSNTNYSFGQTLLQKVFDCVPYGKAGSTVIEGWVDSVPMSLDTDLNADEIIVDGTKYTVTSGQDLNGLLGMKVRVYKNSDGDAIYVSKETKDSDVKTITTYVNAMTATSNYEILVGASDPFDSDLDNVTYDTTSKTKYFVNYAEVDAANVATHVTGCNPAQFIMDGSKVKSVVTLSGKFEAAVDEVDVKNAKIYFDGDLVDQTKTGSELKLKDKEYTLYRNNAPATLADLQPGDILNIYAKLPSSAANLNSLSNYDEPYIIYATANKVTVDLNKAKTKTIKVLGAPVNVVYDTTGKMYKVRAEAKYETASDSGVVNFAVNTDWVTKGATLYLDRWGWVASAKSSAVEADDYKYGIVTKTLYTDYGADDAKLRIYNADGTENTYDITGDSSINVFSGSSWTEANISDGCDLLTVAEGAYLQVGAVVKYSLTSDGKIDSLYVLTNASVGSTSPYATSYVAAYTTALNTADKLGKLNVTYGSLKVQEDAKKIGGYYVTDKTQFVNASDVISGNTYKALATARGGALYYNNDVENVGWDSLADVTNDGQSYDFVALYDDDDLVYVFAVDSDLTSVSGAANPYATILDSYKAGGKDYVKLLAADGKILNVKTVSGDNYASKTNELFTYKLKSDTELDEKLGYVQDAKALDASSMWVADGTYQWKIASVGSDYVKVQKVLATDDSKVGSEIKLKLDSDCVIFNAIDEVVGGKLSTGNYVNAYDTNKDGLLDYVVMFD